MSKPTYTIVSEYKPAREDDSLPYRASAVALDGGLVVTSAWGATRADAVARVQSSLRASKAAPEPQEHFVVDEYGDPVEDKQ